MADLEYIVLNGEKLTIKDNRLNNLANVSKTGSYNDLTDKPVIPNISYDASKNQITIMTQ